MHGVIAITNILEVGGRGFEFCLNSHMRTGLVV